jgi:hypothetical protein
MKMFEKIIFFIFINLVINIVRIRGEEADSESKLYQNFLNEQENFFNDALIDADESDNIDSYESNSYRHGRESPYGTALTRNDDGDDQRYRMYNRMSSLRDENGQQKDLGKFHALLMSIRYGTCLFV